jgi:hypothetical protein
LFNSHPLLKTVYILHCTYTEESILKTPREVQQITYKGKPIRITADFSTETLKARRTWNNIFQSLTENNCQPRLLYPANVSSTIEGKQKTFHDKQKLMEFMTTKPALEMVQ